MLLIMRNFFIKTIVVSFCFVSFNSHAVESIYLICKNNYETTVFGFVVTWVAVFEGYSATPTTDGVSRATTRAVVTGSLAVLGLDYVLTAIMFSEV